MNLLSLIANAILGGARPNQVGFWAERRELACAALPWPGDCVDPQWDPVERAKVIAHLRAGTVKDRYFGQSWCRLCSITELGCADLSDGTYVWPEGFVHYVEQHGVRPPAAFVTHVCGR